MIFIKIIIFQKLVKIGSWGGFGPILDPDSNSVWKTVYTTWSKSIFHWFWKNPIFQKISFCFFWTFGLYFDVFWHYHQTRLEKTRIPSYFHNFWLELRPVYPKNLIYTHFSKIMIFMFFINLYRNGSGAQKPFF